jgi:HK97 family phage major capsid protein
MSLLNTLKEKCQERKEALDGAGAILTKASTEKRGLTTEENAEFDKRHKRGDELKVEIERIERQIDAERELNATRHDTRTAGREDVGDEGEETPEVKEKRTKQESRIFRTWLREGPSGLSPEDQKFMRKAQTTTKEQRALSSIIGSAAAYTVPVGFINTLEIAIKWFGGMLQGCTVMPTENGEQLPWPTSNDTTNLGARIGENQQVASTGADPGFGAVNFNAYMYTSKIVLLPIALVQDSAIDIEPILADMLGMRIGRIVNQETTTGTGASQPNGILNAATLGQTAASNSGIAYSDLINLEHSIDPGYRQLPGVGYMFHDNVLKALKLLVDSNGRPLFIAGGVSEGIQNKSPDTINGFPFTINQDMPSTFSAGNKIALFGALKKYMIRRVRDVAMMRLTERYADSLQIGFMAYQRYDGNLLDAGTHPVKYLQN